MESVEKSTAMTINDDGEDNPIIDECDFPMDSRPNSPQKLKQTGSPAHVDNEEDSSYSSPLTASRMKPLISQQQQRPIVVGYAFGPKKMSTMGVVMAEASKAKLSTNNHLLMPPPATLSGTTKSTTTTTSTITSSLTEARLNDYYRVDDTAQSSGFTTHWNSKPESAYYRVTTSTQSSSSSNMGGGAGTDIAQTPFNKTNIVFILGNSSSNDDGGGADGTNTSLSNIVRHFRSSCSSVCTTASTSTGTTSTGTSLPTMQSQQSKNSSNTNDQTTIPIRVSFVPLDPDVPIEEQHGGTIDVILHKLTEDILCVAQLSTGNSLHVCPSNQQLLAAFQRVHRLVQFRNEHPECSLVDDPLHVQTLMSRADIADTLQKCLQNVETTSGIPVRTPAYAVISSTQSQSSSPELIQNSGLTFPIIVKPLVAAGTKASHAMAVVMDYNGLQTVLADKVPCLCQEYTNHDASLFKVYVLGEHVSVHKRRSLPNLPRNQKSNRSFIEFDSQRPYPRLDDFGFSSDPQILADEEIARKRRRSLNASVSPNAPPATVTGNSVITTEEVMPIVVALKEAFGLELFGFDILVACDDQNESQDDVDQSTSRDSADTQKRMLVVDVNYFPSYKEVPNFPWLLAKYLTDRALENRRRASCCQDDPVAVNTNR